MVRWFLLGSILIVAPVSSFGLSLGQASGRVAIGQPVVLSVPITGTPEEVISDLCATAKVLFAESPVAKKAVSVSVEAGGQGRPAMIHVRTAEVVDEPYVSVEIRAGCTAPQVRQYVFLADFLPDDSKLSKSVVVPGVGHEVTADLSISGSRSDKSTSALTTTPKGTPPKGQSSAGVGKTARAFSKSTTEKTIHRLELDPLVLTEDVANWLPALRLSGALPVFMEEPNEELEKHRILLRGIWAALNETPERWVEATAGVEDVQNQLAQLKVQLQSARQSESDLQAQLLLESETRYVNPLVAFLALSLLVAVASLIVVVMRSRQLNAGRREWWKGRAGKEQIAVDLADQPGQPPVRDTGSSKWGDGASQLDVDLNTLFPPEASLSKVNHGRDVPSQTPPNDSSGFMPSVLTDGNRSVATEELFDLQQQVEFFISLGQSEQAIDILNAHIADGHQASPLAYLDLLKLYHHAGDRESYEQLRSVFNGKFNGRVPSFEDHSLSRRGLERYEKAFSRIQALWPRKEVLSLIEASLFRQSSSENDEVFDLEAYRELLLLYGIAHEIVYDADVHTPNKSAPSASRFGVTLLQPLMMDTKESIQQREQELIALLGSSSDSSPDESREWLDDAELDLDLSSESTLSSPSAFMPAASTSHDSQEVLSVRDRESINHQVDFDISDISDQQSFTIKKSGFKE